MSGNCTQESPTCPKCGAEHELKDCNTQIKACVNCKYAKNVLKVSEINYDHTVFDRRCRCYQREVQKAKQKIKYI